MKQYIGAGILATVSAVSMAQLTDKKILEIEAFASISDTRSKSLLGWDNPLPKFSPLGEEVYKYLELHSKTGKLSPIQIQDILLSGSPRIQISTEIKKRSDATSSSDLAKEFKTKVAQVVQPFEARTPMHTLAFPELQKQLMNFIDVVYNIEKMRRKSEVVERLKQKFLRHPKPSEIEQEIQRIKQIGEGRKKRIEGAKAHSNSPFETNYGDLQKFIIIINILSQQRTERTQESLRDICEGVFGIIGYDRKTPRIDQIGLQIRMLNSLTIATQGSRNFQEKSLQKLRMRFGPHASNSADALFSFAGIPTKGIHDFTLNLPSSNQITKLEDELKKHHSKSHTWNPTIFGKNNPTQNILWTIKSIKKNPKLTNEQSDYFTIFLLGLS